MHSDSIKLTAGEYTFAKMIFTMIDSSMRAAFKRLRRRRALIQTARVAENLSFKNVIFSNILPRITQAHYYLGYKRRRLSYACGCEFSHFKATQAMGARLS
jgi:hypothetical protein